jgi:hypothetical protein
VELSRSRIRKKTFFFFFFQVRKKVFLRIIGPLDEAIYMGPI